MNIFVSNISFHTTENHLQDMFSKFGIVKSVKIIMDKATGRSRGFGFVEMDSESEGDTAIQSLHNTEIEGRQLSVSVARERSNDDRSSFSKKW
jgi:RNA recognition motif-containing protein